MEKLCPGVFGVISLLFLFAGSLSPGWLVLNVWHFTDLSDPDTAEDATLHLGLFYLLQVGENVSISLGYDSIPDEGASYGAEELARDFLEYQIEVIVGIVLCILSLILLTSCYKQYSPPSILMWPIITGTGAGIATGVAICRWLTEVIVQAKKADVIMEVPYSIILSGIGVLFCSIYLILLIVMYNKHLHNG
ncbi:uncharacterized protein LOC134719687 [Mytilus trossulus]|uniref:uncharacterized protein LOC134719687 n=1 Tax=Mytilus trossulus TaxID=6551 RepID=UPI0030043943